MGKKIGIPIGVIILAAALIVCLIPFKEAAYTVMVEYQDTEPYLVESTEPLDYEVVNTEVDTTTFIHETSVVLGGIAESHSTWEETVPVACVFVRNTDSVSGTFNVSFSVLEPFDELMLTTTLYLDPGHVGEARCPAYELGHWEYEVIPETKMVTKTEYREVTKQRPETRYKKVALLDYWLHY